MKATLIFILLSISSSFLFAQKFSVGGEVGIISSIPPSISADGFESRRNTYFNGININYSPNSRISLTSGIQYLRLGFTYNTCNTVFGSNIDELKFKRDYLAIPLIFNLHLLKSRRLILNFGFLAAHNIKNKVMFPERQKRGCEIHNEDSPFPTVENQRLSGLLGIGYKVFSNNTIEVITSVKGFHGISKQDSRELKIASTLASFSVNYKL